MLKKFKKQLSNHKNVPTAHKDVLSLNNIKEKLINNAFLCKCHNHFVAVLNFGDKKKWISTLFLLELKFTESALILV